MWILKPMVQHFQELSPQIKQTPTIPLSDAEFSQALDHLVIACTDIVLLYQHQVLLARRNQYPRKDWWIIGGRMRPGEAPIDSAIRKLDEETNLGQLEQHRLEFVGVYSTCFQQRKQHPQDHGLHSLNLTYRVNLNRGEYERLDLTPQEYQSWRWWKITNLRHCLEHLEPMDTALLTLLEESVQVRNQPFNAASPARPYS